MVSGIYILVLEFVEGTPIFDSEERYQSKLASDFYFYFLTSN